MMIKEKITSQELDILMQTIGKGFNALYLLKDIQNAQKEFPEYNCVLKQFYIEVESTCKEMVLLQLSKLYLTDSDSDAINLQTLSNLANTIDDEDLKELRKQFNIIKKEIHNKEFHTYRNHYIAHNDKGRKEKPDFSLLIETGEKALIFAHQYVCEISKMIGCPYIFKPQNKYDLTSLLTFIRLQKEENNK